MEGLSLPKPRSLDDVAAQPEGTQKFKNKAGKPKNGRDRDEVDAKGQLTL